jgi:hypothetical protein
MKFLALVAPLLCAVALRAAVPAPSQLFPQDTLLLLTVPDWTATKASLGQAPVGRLWADPAMKAFRDRFDAQFREKFLGPLEKDFGVKPEDYLPLLQGQVSFAALKADWNPADEATDPTLVLVVDARDKADDLKARLVEVRQKLVDAKKTMRTDKIRDVEFTTVVLDPKDFKSAENAKGADDESEDEPPAKKGKPPEKLELTFGQVDSALIMATSIKGLDRIVARLTGGAVPVVGELPDFQAAETSAGFREAFGYVFLQAGAVVDAVKTDLAAAGGAFGVQPSQAMAALGLDGLKSLAFAGRQTEAGLLVRFFAGVPEAKRTGIFKLLKFDAKDAAPPAFVPADVAKFQRLRLNGQQLWSGLEAMVKQVSPQLGGLLAMSLNALGKDKDPDFDFAKLFFGNLGDDFVTFEKAPRGKTLPELQNPPALTLVGAVNAGEMLSALKTLASLLPGGSDDLKEREVGGKRIFSVKLPAAPGTPDRRLEISSGGGYVAFATDPALLEEFLRSGDTTERPLRGVAGLAEAAQEVGGMSTGVFGYQNQRESVKALWEALRTEGVGSMVPGAAVKSAEGAAAWFDFSALPPFEQVSKYLGMVVSAGAWEAPGFVFRSYTPTPK